MDISYKSCARVWPGFLQSLSLLSTVILLCCATAGAQTSTLTPVPGTTWAARFDGPAHNTDRRPVMTLDAQGGVYVAAETRSLTDNPEFATTPEMDIVTIKYGAGGVQQWAAVFDGEGNFLDYPHDIGVDSQGSVYVTGYTWRGRNEQGGTEYDFVTIKYDAGGVRKWVRYYAGPQQRSEADQAFFLDLDSAGNVYVTGMAFYNGWEDRLAGQIVTIKYDTNGNELWVRGYTGADRAGAMPQAFDVDGGGNVYVAGQVKRYDPVSNTFDSDHVLLKYDANGQLLYAKQHDSPGLNANDEDYVDYMHLDAQGNVYVLGRTFPGQEFPQNDTGRDMVLMKFTGAGSLVWERTWVTPGDDDFKTFEEIGDELVTDTAGNVYLSGHADDRNLFWAIIAVKFDATGKELWHDIYDPGTGDADWPAGIEIAPDGQSVYVGATARNELDQSHYDFTVIRYAAGGGRTVSRYDAHPSAEVLGPIGANRNVMDIDRAGNLYLAGEAQTPGLRPDLLIEKIGNAPLPQARVNHALSSNGGVASASSHFSDPYWGTFPPRHVNDGSRRAVGGALWLDKTQGVWPDWVEVSFNGVKTVDEVNVITQQDAHQNPSEPTEALTFSAYGATAFEVQYWTGAAWQTVPGGTVTGNDRVWRKLTFPAVTTTKIRVVVNAGADNTYSRLVEVEAWGTPPPVARINHALSSNGGAASASSHFSDPYWGTYPAAAVIDGSRRGASPGALWLDKTPSAWPDWVEVAFSGTKTISEVVVVTQQDDPSAEPTEQATFTKYGVTSFEVQYWTGAAWQAVPGGVVTGNDRVIRRLSFPAVTTARIRVVVTGGKDNSYSRLVEVEAY